MAQGFIRISEAEQVLPSVCALGSAQFAEGSPVSIDSNGFLIVSTTGLKVYGFCTEAVTVIATNSSGSTAGVTQTANSAAVGYAPRVIGYDGVLFWADGDGSITQTKIGEYADIASVSAGVVTMSNTTGATGQFLLVGLAADEDPSAEGDADRGVYQVAEPQQYAFAQS